jgi:hypothetical protein
MAQCSPQERAAIEDFLGAAVVGGPETVGTGLDELANATGADELILVCDVFDTALRLRSLDIAAQAGGGARSNAISLQTENEYA